jgi:hypothetical protein
MCFWKELGRRNVVKVGIASAVSACHAAITLKGYESEDIFGISRIVTSSNGVVIDFEKSGYPPMTL